jgi:hypothetical protein
MWRWKTISKTCEWGKKKQWKLQDEDQWNFRTKMKWRIVGQQHYAMMGFRTLVETFTLGLNTSVCFKYTKMKPNLFLGVDSCQYCIVRLTFW